MINKDTEEFIFSLATAYFTCYLIARSRFLTILIHESLGHHIIGYLPFFQFKAWSYSLTTPTSLHLLLDIYFDVSPIEKINTIAAILNIGHSASFSCYRISRRQFVKTVPENLLYSWGCFGGGLAECIFYPFGIALSANKFFTDERRKKKPIYIGITHGLFLRWLLTMRYMSAPYIHCQKVKNSFIEFPPSLKDYDSAKICDYMYQYKKIPLRTTSGAIVVILTGISFASMYAGHQFYCNRIFLKPPISESIKENLTQQYSNLRKKFF